jgi:outer membrane protein assembly factor BamA
MTRALPCLLIVLCSVGATAQDREDRGARRRDPLDPSALDVLAELPLPGEDEAPMTSAADLGDMAGLPVVRVVAQDPPSGFDPVEDAAIPLGIPLDRDTVRSAIKRLWASENYRDIQLHAARSGAGVVLSIRVEAMLRLKTVAIRGNKAMTDDGVERAIGYVPNGTVLPTAATLIELRTRLQAAYAELGYREAKATLRIETTEEAGKVALVIEVEEGAPERYERIRLRGLPEGISGARLLRRIGLKPGAVRDREKVEKALERLWSELADAGYLDVKIKKYEERRVGARAFELTVPVIPGIHTTLRFEGNRRLLKRALLERLEAKGAVHSTPEGAQAAADSLEAIYREAGLFHARVEPGRVCHLEGAKVVAVPAATRCDPAVIRQELVFVIGEGPPVEVSRIVLEGNDSIPDEELEQEALAFMRERGSSDEVFQQVNTRTVDSLGTSDPRPGRIGRPRGALTPTTEPGRVYVPGRYLELAEHLAGIYWERGFLEATVTDTCAIEAQPPREWRGKRFHPFGIARAGGEKDERERALSPCAFLSADLESLLLVLSVTEGPQTILSGVHVEGNDPDVFTEAELLDKVGTRVGQPYNEFSLREAAGDMRNLYQASGYMFADVTWKSASSEDGELAEVTFHVKEGDRARVSRVIVHTSSTSEVLIRDRIVLRKGDLITPDALSTSEQRLMELAIFDNVTVQMNQPQWPAAKKSISVTVKEAKPQYLELRGGIATVEGLRGGFEYGWRNIFGAALNFRARVRGNYRLIFPGQALKDFERRYYDMSLGDRLERHILLGVSTPHIPGTRGVLGLGIDGINERTNQPAFSADRWSAYIRPRSTYLRFLPIELKAGIERTEIELPSGVDVLSADPRFQQWARMPEGLSTFLVTGATISLDLRDAWFNQEPRNVFNPSRGLFLSVSADLVRSLTNFRPKPVVDEDGDPVIDPETGEQQLIDQASNLVRAHATLSGYIPVFKKDVVLALSASSGYVFHLQPESSTWADRYFYMGGVSTLRGFPEESLVPEDVYQDWKRQLGTYSDDASELLNSRGGESMLLLRAELRFPLARGFFGGLFSEAGNLWRDRDNTSFNPVHLRPVAGGGLRYMTPLGPLALDIGINLDKRPHEDRMAWSFSIGSAF